MTCDESGSPNGGDDGQREDPTRSRTRAGARGDGSTGNAGKADVVPLDALRRRARRDEPEKDPDPGDDPGPAAA
ncbi:MAG TPA: hypothetical protein VF210_09530 [Pseudomonadales bacterium]